MSVRICWLSSATRSGICGGRVNWTETDGRWRSRCTRCGATGRAASGEQRELDAEKEKTP